jgi:hypothetical protein
MVVIVVHPFVDCPRALDARGRELVIRKRNCGARAVSVRDEMTQRAPSFKPPHATCSHHQI